MRLRRHVDLNPFNWLLAIMMLGMFVPTVSQAGEVAVRLIHAPNESTKIEPKADIKDSHPRLEKAFGWREYKVLSQSCSSMNEGQVQQFDLGHGLLLRLKMLKVQKPS